MLAASTPMEKRNIALLFVTVNTAYVLFYFALMVLFNEPLFMAVHKLPVRISTSALIAIQIISMTLTCLIFIGLWQVLVFLNEALWIRASIYINLAFQLYFNVLSVLTILKMHIDLGLVNIPYYLGFAGLVYMAVAMLFVKNNTLKHYFRWVGILSFIIFILVRATPLLYEALGFSWVLINSGVLKMVPFVASLLLFIKYYRNLS